MSEQPDLGPDVDIDEVLAAIDPEFNKSMRELGEIKSADVDLAGDHLDVDADVDVEAPDLTASAPQGLSFPQRVRFRLGNTLGYLLFSLRRGIEFAKYARHAFSHATRAQKAMALGLVSIVLFAGFVLVANVRGSWVPSLNAPVIGHFAPYADHVIAIEEDDAEVRLDLAFPPEVHEFLFKPFKVNLRATSENPHPMGAFEFVISVDAAETATEVRDREVEFADFVQRIFEEQTFPELETELGKERLKAELRTELDQKLGGKRILAVNFKTFVLKP